jgi:hypothetical protein
VYSVAGLVVTFFVKERKGVSLSDAEAGQQDDRAAVAA